MPGWATILLVFALLIVGVLYLRELDRHQDKDRTGIYAVTISDGEVFQYMYSIYAQNEANAIAQATRVWLNEVGPDTECVIVAVECGARHV